MKLLRLGTILFLSIFLVQAQIIVVRVDSKETINPITDQDIEKYNERICKVLLKYTWPTCIAHELTDQEKTELLTPGKAGAELEFVRKKIKEISKDLDVIFIPTTLYELFVIKDIAKLNLSGNQQNISLFYIFNKTKKQIEQEILDKKLRISGAEYIKQEINKDYNQYNNKIISDLFDKKISVLSFHKNLLIYLQNEKYLKKKNFLFDFLYQKRDAIQLKLLQEIQKYNPNLGIEIDYQDSLGIIKKSIDLDYQAFKSNKGLLYRGSNILDINTILSHKKILGTTIHGLNKNIQKIEEISSYSISFGNSLFAGTYYDSGACAYYYLKNLQDMGYVLFVDKFHYMDNYITNLFFIAALATEVGLLGIGQWFHSRSKPAIIHEKKYLFIKGVDWDKILDPYGIFLITRSPYKQAQLFSEYLAKNAVIIHKGDFNALTNQEQQGLAKLIQDQKDIAVEYKVIDWFKNLEHKIKKYLATKKKQRDMQLKPV